MSFSLGATHVALAAFALLAAAVRRRTTRATGPRAALLPLLLFGALAAYAFVMTPHSAWLWARLPLLAHVEFPWRILAAASVCMALLIGSLGARIGARATAAVLALLIVPNLAHALPSGHHTIDPALWTVAEIARRGYGVTTRDEYEPRTVASPAGFRPRVAVITGAATFGEIVRDPRRSTLRVAAATETLLELATNHFPGWTASVDGMPAPIEIAPVTGLIRIRVPSGQHRIDLSFEPTLARRAGELSSLLAVVVGAGWLAAHRLRGARAVRASASLRKPRVVGALSTRP
jgi:hypothetical protein